MNKKIEDLMLQAGYAAPEIAERARKLTDLVIHDIVSQIAMIGVANFQNEHIVSTVETVIKTIKERYS